MEGNEVSLRVVGVGRCERDAPLDDDASAEAEESPMPPPAALDFRRPFAEEVVEDDEAVLVELGLGGVAARDRKRGSGREPDRDNSQSDVPKMRGMRTTRGSQKDRRRDTGAGSTAAVLVQLPREEMALEVGGEAKEHKSAHASSLEIREGARGGGGYDPPSGGRTTECLSHG